MFGLAVGARVFVPKAAGYLEVLFDAGRHEQLLELLGRLRQGVEAAGVEAAGNEVVARAFGGAFDEYGGFDFEESALVEVVADEFHDAVAQDEGVAHPRAAQV